MKLSRLKWTFLATLVALFLFVEFARFNLMPFLDSWQGRLAMDLVILVGSLFFFAFVFVHLARAQERVERHERELAALHRFALDIYGDLSLDTLLQKVVDQAAQLLDARYGAVSVIDENDGILEFITSGVSAEERARIGPPPTGRGLLGVALHEGRRLRVDDIDSDPRSAGMPENHPPMGSLLAVPIVCRGPFRGNLYLTDKGGGEGFSPDDEESLVRFAAAAAIAIDNAHLHERLNNLAIAEERVRIAREMHDGMAQVLAYVNTKAQAVQTLLGRGRHDEASRQLDQLADAAREVYTDAREGIHALRTGVGPERTFREALEEYLAGWRGQSGIDARLEIQGELNLPATVELQLLRILQESLANARKHSRATEVRINLSQEDGRVVAEVHDNGAGFDLQAPTRREHRPRFGLAIMRERAESIDGRLAIGSTLGSGTRVRIEVPLRS